MKKIVRIIALSMVLIVGCAFVLPAGMGTLESHAAAKVKISKTKATVIKGKTLQLKMKGTKKKAKWSSSKKSVAAVTKKGKVTAKKAGKATITAKIGKKKYRCKVTVKNPTVKLSKTSVSATVGTTVKLTATTNGKSKKIAWRSSNNTVASINSAGMVYANNAGSATITASANGVSASCKVTVTAAPAPATPVDPIGSRTNPANLENGVTIPMLYGTAYVKLDRTLKGDSAISQLTSMGQWGEYEIEEYASYPNTQVVYFEYSIKAASGFTNQPLRGLDIINSYGLYNASCSANIPNIEGIDLDGAYGNMTATALRLYSGASSKMYEILFVPNGTNSFSYPILKPDYSYFWTKYTF